MSTETAKPTGLGNAGLACSTLGVIFGLILSIGLGFILSIVGTVVAAVGLSRAGVVVGIIGTGVVPFVGMALLAASH